MTSFTTLMDASCRQLSSRSHSPVISSYGEAVRSVKPFLCRLVLSGMVLAAAPATFSLAAEVDADSLVPADEIVRETVTPEEELLGRMQTIDSVRIVMHALAPADHLANQLSSLLAALGAKQVERRVVDEVPQSNQVRFYHPADREAGQVVGDALGLVFDDVAVRDFGNYQPVPTEGLIEVWLR